MRIALIGYGKMGKTIEQVALQRGHSISHRIGISNAAELYSIGPATTDVAIEFTEPEAAVFNLSYCLQQRVPVVCGTTGWLARHTEVAELCRQTSGALFYASNFSIGVNIFFKINQYLAKLLQPYEQYSVAIDETHHTQKKDAPSGTAISLAQGILAEWTQLQGWALAAPDAPAPDHQLPITAHRIDQVPGTHTVNYQSAIDSIAITHTAHNRHGFALGAVMAAEWLPGRQGIFGMDELLGIPS